jgi:hypothetical protein
MQRLDKHPAMRGMFVARCWAAGQWAAMVRDATMEEVLFSVSAWSARRLIILPTRLNSVSAVQWNGVSRSSLVGSRQLAAGDSRWEEVGR